MWKCPECHRIFKTPNQSHSCVIVPVEAIFEGKSSAIKSLFEQLFLKCSVLGNIKIDTTLSCIYFTDENRFLAIKPQKSGMILEFILDHTCAIFPVIKTIQISKKQIVHRLKLENADDLNEQLIRWIKEAYDLKNKSV